MSDLRDDRSYRRFAWTALLVGFAACAVAWRANRAVLDNLTMMDLSIVTQMRDVQYPFTVDAYGYRYKGLSGSVEDEQILMFGLYEKDRLYFMRDYLQKAAVPGAVVIDGGANTGNHSMFLSRFAAKVHSFEPYPPVIVRFHDNLAANPDIRNIELHEVGLGEHEAELPFVHGPGIEPGGGSFREARAGLPGYEVGEQKLKIVAADEWLAGRESGPIVLVKLDVEGFEEAVLHGMKKIMEANRPVLVVEVGDQPEGTITSIEQLRGLFPADYDLLAFDNTLQAAIDGKYRLLSLTPEVFGSALRQKLDVVAFPRERASLVAG